MRGKQCGKMSLETLTLLFLLMACRGENTKLRDLATIRYHLTPCGSSGRLGPTTDLQCIRYYQDQHSAVARDRIILEQTAPLFRGGQSVRIPRTAVYNVTVAAATGGRGLCNPLFGRGVVIHARAEFEEGLQMLVLVGQRGQGPCEFNEPPVDSFCSRVVSNTTRCNATWWNELLSSAGYSDGLDVYRHTGGGGGGGASMIRLENEGGLQVFPYIVAGGGGGGAAVLNLDFINTVNFTQSENMTTPFEIYQEFVDGKRDELDLVLSDRLTQRGFIAQVSPDDRTAGAGGGYVGGSDPLRRVDGSQLISEDAFAEGGRDCDTSSLFPTTFTAEVGGFGAGGGGCGGGGGGGGHTGGAVVGAGNFVPGGGGYSFRVEGSMSPEILGYDLNGDGDGYVDIVAADCGCVYECVVYEEDDQFECLCPNYTQLAPDLSDCYYTETRKVEHSEWALDIDCGYQFMLVEFGNSTNLFSISAMLTTDTLLNDGGQGNMDVMSSDNVQCIVAFIGEVEEIVLVSIPAQDGHMLTALSEVRINFTEGSVFMSEPTDFLSSAVPVTGAILISGGDCAIHGRLSMNISIQEINENGSGSGNSEVFGYPNLQDAILKDLETTCSLLMRIFQKKPTVHSDTTNATVNLVIALLMAGSAVIIIVILHVCLCACYCRVKDQKKRLCNIKVPLSLTSSLISNAGYVSHRNISSHLFQKNTVASYHSPQVAGSRDTRYTLTMSSKQVAKSSSETNICSLMEETTLCESSFGAGVSPNFFTFNKYRCKSNVHDSEWQYPRNQLSYMRELGEGQFGKVLLMKALQGIAGYRGELPVAVKTLSSRDPEMVAKFMDEAELMKRFSHPNIVSLLGISTIDILDDDNAPLMILEYMPYGDLHAFLVKNRPDSLTLQVNLLETHFVNFAIDVAKALQFLSQLNYVHRDIAARNCLVGSGLQIKIADFGLAREMNDQGYFSVEGDSVLPIRTMAPETFLTGHFTSASDVWSYGVLLWEMVSYGAIPLSGLSSQDIAERALTRQLTHGIPPKCPPALASLISHCHTHDPHHRPSFTDIVETLSTEIAEQTMDTG